MYRIPARDALEVYISEGGHVCLKQEDSMGNEPAIISLEPDLARLVATWLNELADEAVPNYREPSPEPNA